MEGDFGFGMEKFFPYLLAGLHKYLLRWEGLKLMGSMRFQVGKELLIALRGESFAEHVHEMGREGAVHAVAMEDNVH